MHLLIAAQSWAHPGHDQQSANLLTYEFARFFRAAGCRVSFVCTHWADRPYSAQIVAESRAALKAIDVEVLDPIVLPARKEIVQRFSTLLWPKATAFFPEVAYRSIANELTARVRPDAVFIPWSEMTTQLFAEVDVLRVAYYGNPDPKNWRLNSLPPVAPSRGWLRDMLTRIRLFHMERIHVREMRRYDLLGDVALNDVEYYVKNGICDAFYVPMIYKDRTAGDWETRRDKLEQDSDLVIVGNIGSQGATGNRLALAFLADKVLEPLRRAFGAQAYTIHLYGGGKVPADIGQRLSRPEVCNVGYVEDIDRALLKAQVFLCLNNATDYKVNQSRFLHAWSLGSCIVAHCDARLSMPEMVHGENALLGQTPEEIAQLVRLAANDRALRRKLGRNGYATFRRNFTAETVGPGLLQRISMTLAARSISVGR